MSTRRTVDVQALKDWVDKTLPLNSTLREVLLQEVNVMTVDEYLAKCSTWIALARIEDQNKKNRIEKFG